MTPAELRAERKRRCLKQYEAAGQIGVSKDTWNRWDGYGSVPSWTSKWSLSEVFLLRLHRSQ